MRGASALQEVLEQHPDVPLRAFVVWEPVLRTDLTAPATKKLSIVADPRVAQFWDPDRVLSTELVQNALARPERYPLPRDVPPVTVDTIAWDVLLLFPPGATWSDGPPGPMMLGAPVVDAVSALDAALDRIPAR